METLGSLGIFLGGLGVLLIGCGVMWWISLYDKYKSQANIRDS